MNYTSTKAGHHSITDAEHATILAALRYYQQGLNLNGGAPPQDVEAIAADHGEPMTDDEIDDLIENKLNRSDYSQSTGVTIRPEDWELTGYSVDGSRTLDSRLETSIKINNHHFHVVAYSVRRPRGGGPWMATSVLFVNEVDCITLMDEQSKMQVQRIKVPGAKRAQSYLIVAFPFSKG